MKINESGLNEVVNEFGVMSGPIPFKTVARLENVLDAFFTDTQARTHILTGSLKASGYPESDYDADEWHGSITYGGALWRPPLGPGPAQDPVDYAIYEMARGDDHDFFSHAPIFSAQFEQVVADYIPNAK